MTPTDDLIIDDEIQLQQNRDVANRSFTGVFIYLIIWVAITIPNAFHQTSPRIWWFFTLLLTALALLRIILIKNFDRIYAKSPILWKYSFFSQVWVTGLAWGILCALSLAVPEFQLLTFAVITATAGLASGGAASVAPNLILAIGFFSAFLAPPIMTMLFISNQHGISLLLIFIIYWLGMFSITRIQHKEYWLSLKNAFVVKRYAAELEQLNAKDGLTGLKNRTFFDDSLKAERNRSSRTQVPVSLLLIDIDHFKRVNDYYGHLAGDECLRQVSQLLTRMARRETDIVARFGGEEFAILLPGTSAEQSLVVAERTRLGVEKLKIVVQDKELHLTVSIGISNVTATFGTSNEDIIHSADTALYKAKNNGRNQVRIDGYD